MIVQVSRRSLPIMASRLLSVTVTIALLANTPAHSQALVFDVFRDYLESLRIQAGIPGLAVAIVGHNEVIWEHAFGDQDIRRAIATRTDTPFHLDGITQVVTASLVLRCVEEGRLTLDDTVSQFKSDSPDADVTIRELLSHTTTTDDGLRFDYQLDRLDALQNAVTTCTGQPLRQAVGSLLDRLGMPNSVPGPDSIHAEPTAEYSPSVERYAHVLQQLATPYAVDRNGSYVESRYTVTTLSAAEGLMTSAQDFAWFDLAVRNGLLLHASTLDIAWRPLVDRNGLPLPHGLGWFIDTYDGQTVVWQFGVSENASSSIIVTAPKQGLTLILLANSDGLARPLTLAVGGLTQSPFVRLFLELFVRSGTLRSITMR